MSKSLITNSVGRIGRFALSFNFEVNFNLLRRGRKCSELDARQLLVRWELLNCKSGHYDLQHFCSFLEKHLDQSF